MINNMIEGEEQQQNSALADALARRRAKKEKCRKERPKPKHIILKPRHLPVENRGV